MAPNKTSEQITTLLQLLKLHLNSINASHYKDQKPWHKQTSVKKQQAQATKNHLVLVDNVYCEKKKDKWRQLRSSYLVLSA